MIIPYRKIELNVEFLKLKDYDNKEMGLPSLRLCT